MGARKNGHVHVGDTRVPRARPFFLAPINKVTKWVETVPCKCWNMNYSSYLTTIENASQKKPSG